VEAPVPPDVAGSASAVAPAPAGEVEIVTDVPGETVLRATAARSALLVLNDAFAPGWSATLDGAPVPILRTNAVVRGVWIGAGTHELRFRFRTPGLRLGWAIALGGALALGGWALAGRRTARPGAARGA
jgi:hypothetical protein